MSPKVIRNRQYVKAYVKNIQVIYYNENSSIKTYIVMYINYFEVPVNTAIFGPEPEQTFLLLLYSIINCFFGVHAAKLFSLCY